MTVIDKLDLKELYEIDDYLWLEKTIEFRSYALVPKINGFGIPPQAQLGQFFVIGA